MKKDSMFKVIVSLSVMLGCLLQDSSVMASPMTPADHIEKAQDILAWPEQVQAQIEATTNEVRTRLQQKGVDFSMGGIQGPSVAQFAQIQSNTTSTTVLTIAVSTALDPDYLKTLSQMAHRIGVRLVVRGFPVRAEHLAKDYWGSRHQEQRAQKQAIAQGMRVIGTWSQCEQCAPISVDPVFFRTHQIEATPVFVLTDYGPKNDTWVVRVRGAVTMNVALAELNSAVMQALGQALSTVPDNSSEKTMMIERLTRMQKTLNDACQSLWGMGCVR